MAQAFLIRLDVTNAKKVSLNTFFQALSLTKQRTLFGECVCVRYVWGRCFFKSREKFLSETESRFQLQTSNDNDDVETAALHRDLEHTGKIQH